MGERFELLEQARGAVLAEAETFRAELAPALDAALRAGVLRLKANQAARAAGMDPATSSAFEEAIGRAIVAAVRAVDERLRLPDVWLSPLVAPDLGGPDPSGWSMNVPHWLARVMGRPGPPRARLGDLDDPSNRIWVAITSAVPPVDAVLVEFGFEPSTRRIAGGRFGVGARTLARLDPAGVLRQRWRRYRAAYGRFEELTQITG